MDTWRNGGSATFIFPILLLGVRLLLIHPKTPESFWSFRWAVEEILPGTRALNPPLGLATLAALCPPDWDVRIVDENVEPLPLRPEADLIGIGGMGVHAERQKQLHRFFRSSGYATVAGGSYASLCPEEYSGIADFVVAGEAEYVWPRFCRDFERGIARSLYRETGNVDLADSPVPRFDLLKLSSYVTATVQLSRGCPFRCEFCDIIVMFGRRPRYKNVEQIGRELDVLRASGVRKVFFVDDNFIGNKAVAKRVLRYLVAYQARHGRGLRFGTEVSLNLSADSELMDLFRAAGFEWVFLGIETPDSQTLRDVGKLQNLAVDPREAVRRIHANGIEVLGGFIVGFDRDTPAVFPAMGRFIRDSGIMVAMVGLLTAFPRTPLFERLRREGRLAATVRAVDNTRLATNVVPKSMTLAELVTGYRSVYADLFSDRGIAQRVRNKLRQFGSPARVQRETLRETTFILWNFARRGLARGGVGRVWRFLCSLPLSRPPRIPIAISDWIAGLSMRDYAERYLSTAAPKPVPTLRRALARLRRTLRRLHAAGGVRLRLWQAGETVPQIAVRITGRLDRELVRRLIRQFRNILTCTQARLVVAVESLNEHERANVDQLMVSLARYGDRVLIVLGEGLNELIRIEAGGSARAV